jgi:glycosyltransferase involved in cell wall biosynthesis
MRSPVGLLVLPLEKGDPMQPLRRPKLTIVMPAYNEAPVIGRVLGSLPSTVEGFDEVEVVVVDDGSTDETGDIARSAGAIVLRHSINRGLGGALGTGLKAALLRGADVIVTFDADGQHRPEDIERLARPILCGDADAVIGSRMHKNRGMPAVRVAINWLANLLTYLLFGVWTSDSQSGLRAFSRPAAEQIRIRTNRMEVSSEFLTEIRQHNLRLVEVDIPPIYTDYSRRKGQDSLNALSIFFKLILRRLVK